MRRMFQALALASLLPGGGAGAEEQAYQLEVRPAPDGRAVEVRMHTIVDAPIACVQRVLLEVGAYHDWIPHVTSVRILSATRRTAVFETELDLPWPLDDVREVVALESRRTQKGTVVAWSHLQGDLRRNDGRWTLRSLGPSRTDVEYGAVVELRARIPSFLLRRAQEREAPWVIRGLVSRATWYARHPPSLHGVVRAG